MVKNYRLQEMILIVFSILFLWSVRRWNLFASFTFEANPLIFTLWNGIKLWIHLCFVFCHCLFLTSHSLRLLFLFRLTYEMIDLAIFHLYFRKVLIYSEAWMIYQSIYKSFTPFLYLFVPFPWTVHLIDEMYSIFSILCDLWSAHGVVYSLDEKNSWSEKVLQLKHVFLIYESIQLFIPCSWYIRLIQMGYIIWKYSLVVYMHSHDHCQRVKHWNKYFGFQIQSMFFKFLMSHFDSSEFANQKSNQDVKQEDEQEEESVSICD